MLKENLRMVKCIVFHFFAGRSEGEFSCEENRCLWGVRKREWVLVVEAYLRCFISVVIGLFSNLRKRGAMGVRVVLVQLVCCVSFNNGQWYYIVHTRVSILI